MHDFLLAKEIVDAVLAIAKEKKIENIKSVTLEIGIGSVPRDHQHDNLDDEHYEELNLDNVKFGLEAIAKNTILKDTKFVAKKVEGGNWKIINIEV